VRITFSNWLTVPRLTAHALLLAVCLWTVYAYNMFVPGLFDRNGLIKGTDFLHFYTIGSLAADHRGDLLYDMRGQNEFLSQMLPEARNYVYVPLYGPQLSVFFSPFAHFGYLQALTIWLATNGCIYALCCYAVWRCCPQLMQFRWTVALAALAFPGFFHLILWGQTSGLALLCFVLAYVALRNKHDFLAGLALGSLIFKPQLGIAAAVTFLATKQWKLVSGALVAAAAQLAAGWLCFGSSVMKNYWQTLLNIPQVLPFFEPRPYQTHSLRSFFSMLIPMHALALFLYGLAAIAVLYLLVRVWQQKTSPDVQYSALLVATVLVSPHLTVYDLVILAPAFLLLSNEVCNKNSANTVSIQYLLYALFPLFLAGPLARVTHIQLSVLAMAALFWICCNFIREPATQPG